MQKVSWVSVAVFAVAFFSSCGVARADDNSTLTALAFIFIGIVVAGWLAALGFMMYRNKHGKRITPEMRKARHPAMKAFIFFVKYLLIEVIGLVFTIIAIVSIEAKTSANEWGNYDVRDLRIAFYVFTALKYGVVVLLFCIEHCGPKGELKKRQIAIKTGLPLSWPMMLEGAIFIPIVIIDGIFINVELQLDDVGDVFDYDSVVLVAFDSLLFVKLMMQFIFESYSRGGVGFDVKAAMFAIISMSYTLFVTFFAIIVHLDDISATDTNCSRCNEISASFIIMIVNALSHAFVSSYTSMLRQGILAMAKVLEGSNAKIRQVNLYITFFRKDVIGYLISIALYVWIVYVYISIFIVGGIVVGKSDRDEQELQVMVVAVIILVLALTTFYMLNLLFGIAKRLGVYISRCKSPFDCSTYAESMNTVLSTCGANFRYNSHMQIA